MNNPINYSELIIPFLRGELSEDLVEEMKQKIESDSDFKAQVLLQELELEAIYQIKEQAFAEKLKKIKLVSQVEDFGSEKRSTKVRFLNRKRTWTIVSLAASIAVIILLLPQGWFTSSNSELQAQLDQEMTQRKPKWGNSVRGTNNLTPLENSWKKGNYKASIQLLKQNDDELRDSTLILRLGQAYLYSNQTEDAVRLLNDVLKEKTYSKSSLQSAEYFLAIAYLRVEDYLNAEPLISKISGDSSHDYQNAALKLQSILAANSK